MFVAAFNLIDPAALTLAAADPSTGMFWDTLRGLLVLLGVAFLLGMLLERLGQSAILGYLLAGTILGPNALQWVSQDESITAIAELGVALLLFTIGLEFSWSKLRKMGVRTLGIGAMQVILTAALAASASMLFKIGVKEAVAIGAMVALSSTACVLRMLADRAEIDSVHGRLGLGVLLVQDIAVVPLVLLVTVMSTGGTPSEVAWSLGKTLLLGGLLIAAFFLLANVVLPRVMNLRALLANRDLPILLAVVTAVGAAWAAHAVDLSPALGAFVAGILLGESPFSHQIRADVSTLKTLFVTVFFSSIGMLGDIAWAAEHWMLVLFSVFALVVGKAVVIVAVMRIMGIGYRHAIAAGIILAQVGEFSFVLAKIASTGGILGENSFRLIVSTTIASLFVTPYLVAYAAQISGFVESTMIKLRLIRPLDDDAGSEETGKKNHVIVVGFGPAGQRVAQALTRSGIDVVVIDLNPRTAQVAESMKLEGHVGNAGQQEILEHLGVAYAKAVVVTIPDHRAAVQIIRCVRDNAAGVQVIARARYSAYSDDLREAGAHAVVDEEDHVGRRLGIEARKVVGLEAETPTTSSGASDEYAKSVADSEAKGQDGN